LSSEALPEGATRITADWHDPDYDDLVCWTVDFGDGSPLHHGPDYIGPGSGGLCETVDWIGICERRTLNGNGPQEYPYDVPGSETVVVEHDFAPGTYELTFEAMSWRSFCPTASDVTATLTITVP
jgi:hypothetical protein